MHRRSLIATLFGLGTLAAVRPTAAASDAAPSREKAAPRPDPAKVVYHLTEAERVAFVLGNIRNHYDGVGGPDFVTIALVVHGSALKAFHAATATPDTARRLAEFVAMGLNVGACANTMRAQGVTLAGLLPGFTELAAGGVVRIAELQGEGYVYLRP